MLKPLPGCLLESREHTAQEPLCAPVRRRSGKGPIQALRLGCRGCDRKARRFSGTGNFPPSGGSQHRVCLDAGFRRRPANRSFPGSSPDPLSKTEER